MTDAATILRNNGLGLVDELLRAAQLENVSIPIAATIIAGESWGRNIWGQDGGANVRTNGTYKPRTPVTREAYLAYRTEMRAGRIIRQGCGPAQCTSGQYQDTADALGGCWEPVANMRSGFRGMGALMKRYGTRDGARRYNGSGPQAETYATNFMNRLAVWETRLRGASAAAPTVPPPSAATSKEYPDMLDRVLVPGNNSGTIVCPVGAASGARGVGEAWISVRAAGGVTGTVWFQRSADQDGPAPGAGKPFEVHARSAGRPFAQVPSGTEYIEYQLTAGGPGAIGIELFGK